MNLCKTRGFYLSPAAKMYGGLSNSWDYGPLGVEFKDNVKSAWWKKFVQECPYNVGLDRRHPDEPPGVGGHRPCGRLLRPPDGLQGLQDPPPRRQAHRGLHRRVRRRLDQPADDWTSSRSTALSAPTAAARTFTDIRQFNLMFKTFQGVTEDAKNEHATCGPRTAQGIFVNFPSVQRTTRKKLPFGVCPGGQELPQRDHPRQLHLPHPGVRADGAGVLLQARHGSGVVPLLEGATASNWLLSLGMTEENMRLRDHRPEELSFYSKATTDMEYLFPFGWGELWGIADRTDYDLKRHQEHSGKDLTYFDQETNEQLHPLCGGALPGRRPRGPGLPVRRLRRGSGGPGQATARTTSVWCCACIPPWLPSRPRCCPCPKSWATKAQEVHADAVQELHGGLRRRRLHRQALPPPGRDRHASCASPMISTPWRRETRRLRHHPRPGYHGPGAHCPSTS